MGPGSNATPKDIDNASTIGRKIAEEGWVLLSGGRNEGVMDAVNKAAKQAGGLTVGIMPTSDPTTFSHAVDIAVITDMKSARNNINVLSSDVVIACGMESGTASEVALALKANKKVILLSDNEESKIFFKKIGKYNILIANNADEVIELVKNLLG
ncbi:MAG: LOG family protein [Candidatus Aenigmarchaeota archaeon]|nr:LOG family protein [Candidatus Aenigmarchaeota archaeon]